MPPLSLLQPQRWEQSLTDIHHPLPADSLIPMFEGMVDRALSRTHPESASPCSERSCVQCLRAAAPLPAGGFQPPARSGQLRSHSDLDSGRNSHLGIGPS